MAVEKDWKLVSLKKLRDVLVHNNYGLSYRCRRCGTKIYFSLSDRFINIIEIEEGWDRSYPSVLYKVNPEKLHRVLESAIKNLKEDIEKNDNLKRRFIKNIRIKDWLLLR